MSDRLTKERSMHTPGPWYTSPEVCGGLTIESERHGNVAVVNLARASIEDAGLIAAAPELLRALQSLLSWQALAERDDVPMISLDFELAREVVKKATGAA